MNNNFPPQKNFFIRFVTLMHVCFVDVLLLALRDLRAISGFLSCVKNLLEALSGRLQSLKQTFKKDFSQSLFCDSFTWCRSEMAQYTASYTSAINLNLFDNLHAQSRCIYMSNFKISLYDIIAVNDAVIIKNLSLKR